MSTRKREVENKRNRKNCHKRERMKEKEKMGT